MGRPCEDVRGCVFEMGRRDRRLYRGGETDRIGVALKTYDRCWRNGS